MARTNTNNGMGGGGVTSLNALVGAVTLVAGTNISITAMGNALTIASSGGVSFGNPVVGGAPKEILYIDNAGNLFGDLDATRDSVTHDTSIVKTDVLLNQTYLMTIGDPMTGFNVSAFIFNDNASSGNAAIAVVDATVFGGGAGDGAALINANDTTGNIGVQGVFLPDSIFLTTSDSNTGAQGEVTSILGTGTTMSYTDGVAFDTYFTVTTDTALWGNNNNDFLLPLNSPNDGDVLTAPAGGGYGQTRWAPGSGSLTIGQPVTGALSVPAILIVDASNTLQPITNASSFILGTPTHIPYYNSGTGALTSDTNFTRGLDESTEIVSGGLLQAGYTVGMKFGGALGQQMSNTYYDPGAQSGVQEVFTDDSWNASLRDNGLGGVLAQFGMTLSPTPILSMSMVDQVSTFGEGLTLNPGNTVLQTFNANTGRTATLTQTANGANAGIIGTYSDTGTNTAGAFGITNGVGAFLTYEYNDSSNSVNSLLINDTRLAYRSDTIVPGSEYFSITASAVSSGDLSGSGNSTRWLVDDGGLQLTGIADASFTIQNVAGDATLSTSNSQFIFMAGDLGGAQNLTQLTVNDLSQQIILQTDNHTYFQNTSGNLLGDVDAANRIVRFGNLSGAGNNTALTLNDTNGNEFIVQSANNLIQLNSDRVHLNGGQRVSYTYAGADTNLVLQTNTYSVGMNPATVGVLATLPASPFAGDIHIIGDALGNAAAVTNVITVSGNGHNIRGAGNDAITTPFQFRTYEYDGNNGIWQIISIS